MQRRIGLIVFRDRSYSQQQSVGLRAPALWIHRIAPVLRFGTIWFLTGGLLLIDRLIDLFPESRFSGLLARLDGNG